MLVLTNIKRKIMNKLVSLFFGLLLALSFTTTSYSRDQIKIVGSSTVYPYATVVAEKFGKRWQI
jgi:phosphate transport system substrate-binding protein